MARSTCIYVVVKDVDTYRFSVPVAAFTVKHELATWLDQNKWDNDWSIWRLPDGGSGEATPIKCPQDTHNTGKYTGRASPTD